MLRISKSPADLCEGMMSCDQTAVLSSSALHVDMQLQRLLSTTCMQPRDSLATQEAGDSMHACTKLHMRRGTSSTGLTSGAATHEGTPPPSVVLHGKLEVGQGDGDEGRHDDEDDEHDEQDAVDGVALQNTS